MHSLIINRYVLDFFMKIVENIVRFIDESQRCANTSRILNLATLSGGHYVYSNSSNSALFSQPFISINQKQTFELSFVKLFSFFQLLKEQFALTKQFETILNLQRDVKMSKVINIGDFKSKTSTFFNKRSTNLNKPQLFSTKVYLSNWAQTFIQQNSLTPSTFSKQLCFKNLDLKSQQSIRYQMRKLQKKRVGVATRPKIKTGHSTQKSLSLIFLPIMAIEVAICLLSANFYLSLGVDYHLAYILSISVECFYMFSSALSDIRFQVLRIVILGYSIFTVGYSNLINDPTLSKNKELIHYQIQQEERSLKRQEDNLTNLNLEKADLIKTMQDYRDRSYISRGISKISPKIDKINKQRTDTLNTLKNIQYRLELLKTRQVKEESFTWARLLGLHLSTYAIIFGFILMQICSSIYLTPCLNSLGKDLRRTKKYWRKLYATT